MVQQDDNTASSNWPPSLPALDQRRQPQRRRLELATQHDPPAPAALCRTPPSNTAHADVIDDTLTSWLPDDAGHGCHGYGDVSESDDDAQDGGDALCMTRLDVDCH